MVCRRPPFSHSPKLHRSPATLCNCTLVQYNQRR
jgi:hypothetical protein